MSSPNTAYWSLIHKHFECVAAQYQLSSPRGTTATASCSDVMWSLSSSPSASPTPSHSSLYSSDSLGIEEEKDCACGFDFCKDFCAGVPDTESSFEDLQPDANTEECFSYECWMAAQDAQAVTVLIGLYIALPDPQASVDSIPCNTESEMRIWAQCTRVVSERRQAKCWFGDAIA